jgi:hypothetical protein
MVLKPYGKKNPFENFQKGFEMGYNDSLIIRPHCLHLLSLQHLYNQDIKLIVRKT